jgi:hypothetical protein
VPWAAGWLAALLTVSVLEVPLGFVDRAMFLSVTLVPLCLLVCGEPMAGRARGLRPATGEQSTGSRSG